MWKSHSPAAVDAAVAVDAAADAAAADVAAVAAADDVVGVAVTERRHQQWPLL